VSFLHVKFSEKFATRVHPNGDPLLMIVEIARMLNAIEEHLDWLTEEECAADASGNRPYADAMARASSELGLTLIKHNVYLQKRVEPTGGVE
jgi:hypothetical protein